VASVFVRVCLITIAPLIAIAFGADTRDVNARVVAAVAPSPAALTVYPKTGRASDSHVVPHGPGLVLMGGGDRVNSAFVWMHDTIVGEHTVRGGDVIVLRATGTNEYDGYIMDVAPFNSVRTIVIGRTAGTADFERAAAYVDRAQGVFFSGGDQANYARWKGTPLMAAVQRLYARGGVVGGTSAGLAMLGEYAYDSVAADAAGDDVLVTTQNAVADPSEHIISFTHDLLVFPSMRRIITDSHFVTRDRFGRLAVFVALLSRSHSNSVMGVGIDEGTAIVVDHLGIGTLLLERPNGSALLVRVGPGARVAAGQPFVATTIHVVLLDHHGQHLDFKTWCAPGARSYAVSIAGTRKPIYEPVDPYRASASARVETCPADKEMQPG
jgi:cyanophycinase